MRLARLDSPGGKVWTLMIGTHALALSELFRHPYASLALIWLWLHPVEPDA